MIYRIRFPYNLSGTHGFLLEQASDIPSLLRRLIDHAKVLTAPTSRWDLKSAA
jgi:hypothetical protein